MAQGQRFDSRVVAPFVHPEIEKIPDFFEREVEIARAMDKAQDANVGVGIDTIAVAGALRRRDEADAFVMADCLCSDTGLRR